MVVSVSYILAVAVPKFVMKFTFDVNNSSFLSCSLTACSISHSL